VVKRTWSTVTIASPQSSTTDPGAEVGERATVEGLARDPGGRRRVPAHDEQRGAVGSIAGLDPVSPAGAIARGSPSGAAT
jgi:hypothetical protein